MTTPQQTLERAYAALSAAAFAHPSAADEIGTQCSEAAKELRALLATQAQGQDAAPAERSKSCLWSHADDDTDLWETSCGNAASIICGTPEENEFRHCCYCGGVLETARAKE